MRKTVASCLICIVLVSLASALVLLPKGVPPWANYPAWPFLSLKITGGQEIAQRYYSEIDPQNQRSNFADWLALNGFNPDGSGGTVAVYYNSNELGLGRKLGCLKSADSAGDPTIACWIISYGNGFLDPHAADEALQGTNIHNVDAIEYRPLVPGDASTYATNFLVYGGQSYSDYSKVILQNWAQLDPITARPVPQICTNCHGGTYSPNTSTPPSPQEAQMGASFIGLNLATLGFPKALPRSSQEANFKSLNQLLATTNPAPPIAAEVSGWYAGDVAKQKPIFIPAGWQGSPEQEQLLTKVVRPYCADCHYALGVSITGQPIDFSSYSQFQHEYSQIQNLVCGPNKIMPHAYITYRKFWLSGAAQVLANYSAPDWPQFGACQ
jgi:hypothetical protein